MRTPKQNIQWTICESDDQWQQAHVETVAPGLAATGGLLRVAARSRWLWLIGLAFVILLFAAGAWGWYAAQRGLAQDEAELQTALHLEQWAVSQHDVRAARLGLDLEAIVRPQFYDAEFNRLVHIDHFHNVPREYDQTDQAISMPLTATLDLVDLRGDLAVVDVHFLPDVGPAYHQTRFYRRTEKGWLRTAPDPTLWGQPRTLETVQFNWHYRQGDQLVVAAIADRADTMAATIAATFGLTRRDAAKLDVTVSVDMPPFVVAPDASASIILASPATYLAPETLGDEELLLQALAFALVERAVNQASTRPNLQASWRPAMDALALWQLSHLNLPLAASEDALVSAIFAGYGMVDGDARTAPERLVASVCAGYAIWLADPADWHLPIACDPPGLLPAEPPLLTVSAWMGPLNASQGLLNVIEISGYSSHPGQVVALETVLEYLAITNGPGRMSIPVTALERYSTWDTLLRALFGVSAGEVEDGWCAYLHDRYRVVCALD